MLAKTIPRILIMNKRRELEIRVQLAFAIPIPTTAKGGTRETEIATPGKVVFISFFVREKATANPATTAIAAEIKLGLAKRIISSLIDSPTEKKTVTKTEAPRAKRTERTIVLKERPMRFPSDMTKPIAKLRIG